MEKLLVLYVFHIYNNRVKNFIKIAFLKTKILIFILISNNCHEKFLILNMLNFFLRKYWV